MHFYRYFLLSLLFLSHVSLAACQQPQGGSQTSADSIPPEPPVATPLPLHSVVPDSVPKDYFDHPLHIPVSLSAAFAEIRPNHYHSGIDLRVGGKVGENVYADADGYISRIRVSPWGGGKHIYITHPNGLRSVYMHLNDYCEPLASFVRDYQYAHQTFAFDVDLPPDSITVTKGQLLAHAGNTGGSGGPHLHYEIRFADNDQPINPLYFGMRYTDPVKPTIANVKLYPASPSSVLDGSRLPWFNVVTKKGRKGSYTKRTDSLQVFGPFYAGIFCYDVSEPSTGRNGVERIELYVDGNLFWSYHSPTFLFEETRAVNALIDYPQYAATKDYYILTRTLPGVPNSPSHPVAGNGVISFSDNSLHSLEYRVYDLKGNVTKRHLKVRSLSATPAVEPLPAVARGESEPLDYRRPLRFRRSDVSLLIPPYSLYDHDTIVHNRLQPSGTLLSTVHYFAPLVNDIPPHFAMTLSLPVPEGYSSLASHLVIVSVDGSRLSAQSTKLQGNRLVTDIKSFGSYSVALDTVPPTLKPSNFADNRRFTGNELLVKISDDLSGIATYACFINDSWHLAEYDPKTASLMVPVRGILQPGPNSVVFRLSDAAGNSHESSFSITR